MTLLEEAAEDFHPTEKKQCGILTKRVKRGFVGLAYRRWVEEYVTESVLYSDAVTKYLKHIQEMSLDYFLQLLVYLNTKHAN